MSSTTQVFSSMTSIIILTVCLMMIPLSSSASGPTFLDKFSDQTLDPGPSVSLRCIASGHPLPQVTWLLNGLPVPDNSRFRTGDYVTRDLVVVSYVNISSVVTSDGGVYVSNFLVYFRVLCVLFSAFFVPATSFSSQSRLRFFCYNILCVIHE